MPNSNGGAMPQNAQQMQQPYGAQQYGGGMQGFGGGNRQYQQPQGGYGNPQYGGGTQSRYMPQMPQYGGYGGGYGNQQSQNGYGQPQYGSASIGAGGKPGPSNPQQIQAPQSINKFETGAQNLSASPVQMTQQTVPYQIDQSATTDPSSPYFQGK